MSDTPVQPTPRRKPKAKSRRWPKILAGVGISLLLLLLLAPTLAGTAPIRGLITSKASEVIPGSIELDDLSLGWFSGQRIGAVRVLDPDGQVVAALKGIEIDDVTILGAALGNMDVGTIRILEPRLTIQGGADGTTNLHRALGIEAEATESEEEAVDEAESAGGLPEGLKVRIEVVNPVVQASLEGEPPFEMTMETMLAALTAPGNVESEMVGSFSFGKSRGDFSNKMQGQNLLDAAGNVFPAGATLQANTALNDLPVSVMDRIAMQEGKLLKLLGPVLTLTANADISGSNGKPQGKVVAGIASSGVNGNLNLTMTEAGLQLSQEGDNRMDMVLTPDLVAAVMEPEPVPPGEEPPGPPPELLSPRPVAVTLKSFNFPLDKGLQGASFEAQIDSDILDFTMREPNYLMTLKDAKMLARKNADDTGVSVDLDSQLFSSRKAGDKAMSGVLKGQIQMPDVLAEEVEDPLIKLDFSGNGLPVDYVDDVLEMEGKVAMLIGPVAQTKAVGTIGGQKPGRIALELGSNRAASNFDLIIEENQLRMSKDSRSEIRMTTASTNKLFLKYIAPGMKAKAANDMVKLSIKGDTFALPTEEFDINKVNMDLQLELGNFLLSSDSMVFQALRQIPKLKLPQRLPANCGPIGVSIANGKCTLTGMKMSIDQLGLGFDGHIDLNAMALNMNLGISTDSLMRMVSELRGLLPPGDVIRLPLTGTVDKPVLDQAALMKTLAPFLKKAAVNKGMQLLAEELNKDDKSGKSGEKDVVKGLLKGFLKKKKDDK